MKHEHLIWLTVVEKLAWENNPLRQLVSEWGDKTRHVIDIPKNRRLTQEHLERERQRLAGMEAAARHIAHCEWEATGERLNHLR